MRTCCQLVRRVGSSVGNGVHEPMLRLRNCEEPISIRATYARAYVDYSQSQHTSAADICCLIAPVDCPSIRDILGCVWESLGLLDSNDELRQTFGGRHSILNGCYKSREAKVAAMNRGECGGPYHSALFQISFHGREEDENYEDFDSLLCPIACLYKAPMKPSVALSIESDQETRLAKRRKILAIGNMPFYR